jgi:hypothetical protein
MSARERAADVEEILMRMLIFAATLMLGTAAAAQDAGQEEMAADTSLAGSTVAPGNSAPERDARGIPVVSAPATAPAGANQGVPAAPAGTQAVPAPNQAQVFSTRPSTENYVPCTREVTDNCVQTYERGVPDPE